MQDKPETVPVISQYLPLRKAGREYLGCCLFHEDKTPSFSVSEEKGLFHCFGCGASGDIFDFVMRIEGIDFQTALKRLGRETYKPSPERIRQRDEAREIAEWARPLSYRIRDALRERGEAIQLCSDLRGANTVYLSNDLARLQREWDVLVDLDDDLTEPAHVVRIFKEARPEIEAVVGAL